MSRTVNTLFMYKQCEQRVDLCVFVIFPAPKRASRIIWNPDLEDDSLNPHSPRHTPTKPRSVLRQVTTSVLTIQLYSVKLYAQDTSTEIIILKKYEKKQIDTIAILYRQVMCTYKYCKLFQGVTVTQIYVFYVPVQDIIIKNVYLLNRFPL